MIFTDRRLRREGFLKGDLWQFNVNLAVVNCDFAKELVGKWNNGSIKTIA
jgi:hypothetical protein